MLLKGFCFTLLVLGLLLSSIDARAGGMVISPAVITTGGSATIRSDNTDLGFGSGSTTFPHWIEQSSSDGTATFWAKIPVIYPGNTNVQMFYNGTPLVGSFSTVFTKNYEDTGLVGLWHFDEGSGSTANDSSGLGHTGTLTNMDVAIAWQTTDGGQWNGRSDVKFNIGSSLKFDGVNDYIVVTRTPNLNLTSAFTLMAWISSDAGLQGCSVISEAFAGDGIVQYALGFGFNEGAGGSSKLKVGFYDGAVWRVIVDTISISPINNMLIVGTWDGTTLRLYRNDQMVASGSPGVSIPAGTENFYIGRRHDTAGSVNFFPGIIDEVRIYNRALPLEEIRAHYERRKFAGAGITVSVTYGAEQDNPGTIYPELSKMRTVTINNSGTNAITNYQLKIPIKINSLGTIVAN